MKPLRKLGMELRIALGAVTRLLHLFVAKLDEGATVSRSQLHNLTANRSNALRLLGSE